MKAAAACLLTIAGLFRAAAQQPVVDPGKLAKAGTVDERFQSYNVEMVEVTGGRFWAPYKLGADAPKPSTNAAPGLDPSLFRTRDPIDLADPRLRKLAAALGPAYVRVSGTWANSTYFHDSDEPAPASPPPGFGGVLTRRQWKGVLDFNRAVNGALVTSFAISPGVRDDRGVWSSSQAQHLLDFTRRSGGSIAAAEFFNEPSFAALGGAPKGYDAAAYARDFSVFLPFARQAAPAMKILGIGSVGEAVPLAPFPVVKSEDILQATGGGKLDVFSYHFYGAASQRCAGMGESAQTNAAAALGDEWLARTVRDAGFYFALRDRFEPGKPVWLTETAEAACGGNPWAATFLDSFRYLNQLGALARRGVQVVMHNTLAASDYGLIDETTMTPRPNYWSALLWRRLMGATVLDAGAPAPSPGLRVYAHCLRGASKPGGVVLLAMNLSRTAPASLEIGRRAERYTLAAAGAPGELQAARVSLNGVELSAGPGGELPAFKPARQAAGVVALAPGTITFLAFPEAANPACPASR